MRWDFAGHIASYAIPAVLGTIAFAIKLPLLRRAWQDPILRATALLLGLGVVTFASLPPRQLHRINDITGIPNFAAPWAYSLITAYCGACLWLVILWRKPPSAARRRQTRLVGIIYTTIIVGLWVTFLLGDHRVERLRDLDTYYANTPWMREHIVLYLAAHTVSTVVTAGILGAWFKEIDRAWLRRAVVCLQLAYGLGFVYDVFKICAVGARWTGRNWDWLSTYVAPPFSMAEAFLIAVGFIIGQVGPLAEDRWTMWRTHRRLEPLWRLMQTISASPAPVTGRVSGTALQLELRKAVINDGLLRLAPHLSTIRREQARSAALAAGHREADARDIAGAADVLTAIDTLQSARATTPAGLPLAESATPTSRIPDDELESVARALRLHASAVETIRRRMATTKGPA
ncbi:MAB_1171c family putative transporter [Streptomyces sp. NBC_00557]|uniref:MAB_1171c family putative transporter n=1 Tax=Streptomyces sp. NBC_00557 TaxID=2975776 RepID=UPI002E80B8AA|nr:MAB_1171c family putative transporter [Streptomyces sp. NBC_00557]WUC40305.1 hypothetical protein OG956_39830 [Streptomyces sp. NBC_00557]